MPGVVQHHGLTYFPYHPMITYEQIEDIYVHICIYMYILYIYIFTQYIQYGILGTDSKNLLLTFLAKPSRFAWEVPHQEMSDFEQR
jgi:hypothetical protein